MRNRSIIAISSVLFCAYIAIAGRAASGKATSGKTGSEDSVSACDKSVLVNFEILRNGNLVNEVPIWQSPPKAQPLGASAVFFQSGMTIDADGAPNAYNPQNTGLDDLANAGVPGHWDGVVQDENGDPYIQGPDDPFPGYYVSCTSLCNRNKRSADPRRYVDASKIPYVVLPGGVARQAGARLGDFALVMNLRNGKSSYAIFADIGTLGEGSVALAENLEIHSDARIGGTRGGVLYVIFPGSGNGAPRSIEEINSEAGARAELWGGIAQVNACMMD
jgi:Fungal chitosanase of glycosyl hydrolase group 75